jgi:sigma-B regulation protein RsbU (phosphoserine phosphatase)
MRLSLSFKLSLLLLTALAGVLIPALTITWSHVTDSDLRTDKQVFSAMLKRIEESINAGFLYMNTAKVSSVIHSKDELHVGAIAFASRRSMINESLDPATALPLEQLQKKQLAEYATQNILIGSLVPVDSWTGPQTELGLLPGLLDFKGSTLAETLARIPSNGVYTLYRMPERGPMLFYFLPLPGGEVAFSATSLQKMETEAENAVQALIRSIQDRFSSLPLYRDGFIVMFDVWGQTLAEQGVFGASELDTIKPLLEEARGNDGVEAVLHMRRSSGLDEEMLVAVNFSRLFNWHTVVAAPLREVNASSHTLLFRLITQSLCLGLLVMAAGMWLLTRTMRPLRQVLRKIKILPSLDFSSPDASAALARGLPLERQDDVGDMARSFASMGEQLNANVRALMESASARERMQGELDAARDIQQGILPSPELAPNIFGLSSHALLDPARETGGDLYDFFTMPDGRHAFVIGDVSGKGVPAALFMAMTVTLVRLVLGGDEDPGTAMSKVNEFLQAHNPGTMFVTLFLAIYEPRSGRLEYANGGHNPPYLLRVSGQGISVQPLQGDSGPLVGVMPGLTYNSCSWTLEENELCLLYTDGITEAINENLDAYGEERLTRYLREHAALSTQDLLEGLFDDIKLFRGQAAPFDDITMLAFARRGAG